MKIRLVTGIVITLLSSVGTNIFASDSVVIPPNQVETLHNKLPERLQEQVLLRKTSPFGVYGTIYDASPRNVLVRSVYEQMERLLLAEQTGSREIDAAGVEELKALKDGLIEAALNIWVFHKLRFPTEVGEQIYEFDSRFIRFSMDYLEGVLKKRMEAKKLLSALKVLEDTFVACSVLQATEDIEKYMPEIKRLTRQHFLVTANLVTESDIKNLLKKLRGKKPSPFLSS